MELLLEKSLLGIGVKLESRVLFFDFKAFLIKSFYYM